MALSCKAWSQFRSLAQIVLQAAFDRIHVLLPVVGLRASAQITDAEWLWLQASQPVYHSIAPSMSMSSQLARKTIIEYPELLVLLPDEIADYSLQEGATTVAYSGVGQSTPACTIYQQLPSAVAA